MKPEQPILAKMSSTDLSAVITLGEEAYTQLSSGTTLPQFYDRETLENWVNSPNGILLTASIDGSPVGFSLTSYNPDSREGYIHALVVSDRQRRRGVGNLLLETTLNALEQIDGGRCNNVYCLIKPTNVPIQRLFQRHGFQIGEPFLYVERSLPTRR